MTNKAQVNISIELKIIALFKQLCLEENVSFEQALKDYMVQCIQLKRLIKKEDINQLPDNLEKIIDQRIAAALETQKTQMKALMKSRVEEDVDDLIDETTNIIWENRTAANTQTDTVIEAKAPMVLVVEDSMTVRELLCLSLSKGGYQIEKASDGQEAWEKLQSGLVCDLILCDIEMPRMDGLELLSHIRKDKKLSQVPVAILTFLKDEKYQQTAAQLGASGYFIKPFIEQELLDAAQRIIDGEVLLTNSTRASASLRSQPEIDTATTGALPQQVQRQAQKNLEPMVFVIDDSVVIRQMVAMTFSRAGYKVEQARDGQEAWEKLQSGLHCDLIICDIEMPKMNGLEFLSQVQKDPHLAQVPVAMLTSRGAQKMKQIAAERGAKAYFVKPYVEKILIASAQRLLDGEILLEKSIV